MVALTLNPIYEDEVFRIGIDKQFAVLELTFLRHPDAAHFRNAYNLAFGTAESKNIKYWLTDATQIKSMERENQAWLVENMTPLLNSNQIRRFAIVMAPECFVMTNPNQVYEKPGSENKTSSSGSLKVHFDKEAGYQWLFSSKETEAV
jgi:hypothetical protein